MISALLANATHHWTLLSNQVLIPTWQFLSLQLSALAGPVIAYLGAKLQAPLFFLRFTIASHPLVAVSTALAAGVLCTITAFAIRALSHGERDT
jgi:hypothetical protein